ncbi:MAG: hypothetical protein WA581_13805 [Candidatus Acidiferrales bacterium]
MGSKCTVRMSLGTWSSHQLGAAWVRTLRRESRGRKRLKMSLALHVRPLDERFADQDDLGEVVDFNCDGLYFTTSKVHYTPGMKLDVTFPYGDNVPAHRKFVGSVVRVEHLWIGSRGIGIRLAGEASAS